MKEMKSSKSFVMNHCQKDGFLINNRNKIVSIFLVSSLIYSTRKAETEHSFHYETFLIISQNMPLIKEEKVSACPTLQIPEERYQLPKISFSHFYQKYKRLRTATAQ